MNNEYLTTELIIACIEMQKDPIPAMGLLSIEVELCQDTAEYYSFIKTVKTLSGNTIVLDSCLPKSEVDDLFNKERKRRIFQAVKEAIVDFEIEKNGLKDIPGSYVRAFNVVEKKDTCSCSVVIGYSCSVVIGNSETKEKVRNDNCEYSKNIIRLGRIK